MRINNRAFFKHLQEIVTNPKYSLEEQMRAAELLVALNGQNTRYPKAVGEKIKKKKQDFSKLDKFL